MQFLFKVKKQTLSKNSCKRSAFFIYQMSLKIYGDVVFQYSLNQYIKIFSTQRSFQALFRFCKGLL